MRVQRRSPGAAARIAAAGALGVLGGLGAAHADTTVNVEYLWFDRGGTATHPLRGINVEFYDDDAPLAPDVFGTFTTNVSGIASATANVTDPLDDTLEVYTEVRMEITGVASVKTTHAAAQPLKLRIPTGGGFFLAAEDQGAPPNSFGPASVANGDNTIRALPVLQLIRHMNGYYKAAPFNATLPALL